MTPSSAAPDSQNAGSSDEKPKGGIHWGVKIAALYLLTLLVVTLPVTGLSFPSEFHSSWKVFREPMYWGLIGVLCLSYFLLLFVPVRLVKQRPISRASVWLPIVASTFWMGCLVLGGLFSLAEAFKARGEFGWIAIGSLLLAWGIWAVIFARMSRKVTPRDMVEKQSRVMLKGSILELLIAVPSHIVVRWRGECCAGFFTFFGITMGISVMLLSFGPAVFFLYYARWQKLQPKKS